MVSLVGVTFVFLALVNGVNSAAVANCPPSEIHNCLVNPCIYSLCVVGTRCVANYCGGCNAECVPVGDDCPPDQLVQCLIDPCSTAKCGSGTVCRSNYCGGCNAVCEPVSACVYNGVTHQLSDSFPSTDGCNTCHCLEGGEVSCTKIYCPPTCEYNGETYKAGDSFKDADNCNQCSCTDTGAVICTRKICPPTCEYNGVTYLAGQNFSSTDGCNNCFCGADGQVACTELYCPPKCPQLKCVACPNGYEYDENDCQTCTCLDKCGKRSCKSKEFCSNGDCCPNWVLSARCADPCSDKKCRPHQKCERFCNCYARCVLDL